MNISLIDHRDFNCYEEILASYLKFLNLDYRSMFLYSWDFFYTSKKNIVESIENSMTHKSNIVDLALLKISGIKLKKAKLRSNIIETLQESLNKGKPVIASLDVYWCSWNNRYNKVHEQHFVIIRGIDIESRKIKCIDKLSWYEFKSDVEISFDDFLKGYHFFLVLDLPTTEVTQDEKLFRKNTPFLFSNKDKIRKQFKMIRQFAYDLKRESLNDKFLITDINQLILLEKLHNIAAYRRNFATSLQFVSEKLSNSQLLKLSNDFYSNSYIWNEVRVRLHDAANKENQYENISKSSELVYKLADFEEKFYNNLVECVRSNSI